LLIKNNDLKGECPDLLGKPLGREISIDHKRNGIKKKYA
jgi:hypothetical protein